MFLLLLTQPILGAVFGIDFGCEYIKVGMAIPGRGVHVALNQQSKRLSPSYFAMWNTSNPRQSRKNGERWTLDELEDCTWAFLDAAKSHSLRFPHNMVKGISPITENINGFTRREAMALVLRHLVATVDGERWTPEVAQVVLTVEPFLPRVDRMAIIEAVRLSNATLTSIIDSPTAAAQVYSLEKRALYQDKPKIVMFVDMGASYTWAALFQFVNEKTQPIAHELSIVTNSSLGGNLMDEAIADLLIAKFKEQNKNVQDDEIDGNEKLRKRFIEESRRAKELLTINKVVDVKMEDVVDDAMLNYKLTKEEFESLITDFNLSLINLWNSALEEANLTAEDVDSIELIGGVTRVPYIQDVLCSVSGMEKLNRTMNSDEAVALGAGYVGASQSNAFIVMKTQMAPFANTNVTLLHKGVETQLFGIKSRLNETVNYTFPASENDNVTLFADGVAFETFFLNLPENTTDDVNVTLTLGFDEMTMPWILKVFVNDTAVSPNFTITRAKWMLTEEDFFASSQIIHRMDEILEERRRFQAIHNDYEGYIYKIKDKLEYDPVFKKVVNETERTNLTELAESHQQWLFGDHEFPLNYTILDEKLQEIKSAAKSAERRAEEYVKRAPAFSKLNKTLNMVFNDMNVTWPETKPWLTEEQLETLWRTYNRTKEWLQEKYAEQLNKSDWEDPAVTVGEISTQQMLLEWSYNSTKRIQKPTPTPAPKPDNETELIKDIEKILNETLHNETVENETETEGGGPSPEAKEVEGEASDAPASDEEPESSSDEGANVDAPQAETPPLETPGPGDEPPANDPEL